MADLVKSKKVVAGDALKKEKGKDFYKELDNYRAKRGFQPVFWLVLLMLLFVVMLGWYLHKDGLI